MKKGPVIILHLQKTAGNAIKHYLETGFPADETINSLGHEQETQAALARHAQMTDQQRTKLRVIFGHAAKVFRPLYSDSPCVTFVRDPFDRAISQYFYERRNAAALNLREEDLPLPEELTQKEFMDHFLHWGTRPSDRSFELQARTVADFFDIDVKDITPKDIPELASRFDFIGVQNEFPLSIFLLSRIYGFPLIPIPLVNAHSNLLKPYFPRSFVREVYENSPLDTALFNLARDRLEQYAERRLTAAGDWRAWNMFQLKSESELRKNLTQAYRLPPSQGYVTATLSRENAVTLTDGHAVDVASINLPVGDWDVGGMVTFVGETSTLVKYTVASLSPNSARIDSDPGKRIDIVYGESATMPVFANGNLPTAPFPTVRIRLDEPTVLHLVALAEFAKGEMFAFGTISARIAGTASNPSS